MNNPNPFIPQGSLLEQKNKKRARVRLAVFSIFAVNILVISPLLIQGCKKEAPATDTSSTTPAPDTNATPVVDTNTPPPLTNPAPTAVVSNVPPPAPPPAPPAPTTQEYVVAKGDTYSSIAKHFGVKVKEVEAANPTVLPTKLKVGEKIQIHAPGGGTAGEGNLTPAPTATTETVYVVKSGDTLTKIAKDHGTTVKAIRAANDLKTDKIKVGEKLKVPEKSTATEAPAASAPAPAPEPAPSAPAPAPGH